MLGGLIESPVLNRDESVKTMEAENHLQNAVFTCPNKLKENHQN